MVLVSPKGMEICLSDWQTTVALVGEVSRLKFDTILWHQNNISVHLHPPNFNKCLIITIQDAKVDTPSLITWPKRILESRLWSSFPNVIMKQQHPGTVRDRNVYTHHRQHVPSFQSGNIRALRSTVLLNEAGERKHKHGPCAFKTPSCFIWWGKRH